MKKSGGFLSHPLNPFYSILKHKSPLNFFPYKITAILLITAEEQAVGISLVPYRHLNPPLFTEITFRLTKKQAYQFLRVAFSFLRYNFETVGNLSPPVLAESERSDA